jgi:hypothetical protein
MSRSQIDDDRATKRQRIEIREENDDEDELMIDQPSLNDDDDKLKVASIMNKMIDSHCVHSRSYYQ